MRQPVFHRRFGYDLGLLPNAHLAKLETGVSSIEEARKKSGATIGYPGWGLLYHILLAHLDQSKPEGEIIIETGTNWGCTTIVLAQSLADSGRRGQVHTFEIEPENVMRARQNIEAAGLTDLVTFHEGDSRVMLKEMLKGRGGIRFAFLDASHLYDDVLAEFELVAPHLADDALVVMDNTYQIAEPGEDQRVNGALPEIVRRHGGNLINLEFVSWFTPGIALWQKKPKL